MLEEAKGHLYVCRAAGDDIYNRISIHPSNGSTAQIGLWPPPLRFLNHTELDTVGLLWTCDQPVAETST
jgi:hypothetical protein